MTKFRILIVALLWLSLVTAVAMPRDIGNAQEPAPAGARWIPFEAGSTPALPTLQVAAADPTRMDLAAHVPGCFATDVETAGDTYTQLAGEGFGHATQIGRPDLPVLRQSVEIPFEAQFRLELLHADVSEYDLKELGVHHLIYPLQPPLPKVPGAQGDQPFELDAGFYQTDAFYPAEPVVVTQEYVVRGHRALVVEVWPVAYNPATGRVRVYSHVQFRLHLTGSDMAKTTRLARRYASPAFEGHLARRLLNYNQGQQGLYDLGKTSVGYLIITADAYYSSMTPFVTLKTGQGFTVTMTRLSEIPGGATNTAIKAYIQNAYNTWNPPPSYVLLVGDTDTMPGWNSVNANEITDLYYGTMDGSSDWVPDIGRGRFPVRSAAQTTAMVNKYLAYASLTGQEPWLKKIAFPATCDLWSVAEGTHNYVINNYTLPEGYTGIFPNNPQPGGDKLYCHTYSAQHSNLVTAFNDGRWAIIYSGHGSWTGWEMGYSSSDVQALTSTGVFPFVASHACITGDFAVTEVFGETWVRQPNKGALAFWGSSDSSFWDEDDVLERAAFDSLFGVEPQPALAGMTDDGLAAVQAAYPGSARYYWETYNILGDPALRLFIEAPDFTLSVSPPTQAVAQTGTAAYTVQVAPVLGYAETVTLNVTNVPPNSQATLVPSAGTPPFIATLSVTTTAATPIGPYTMTVTGVGSGSLVHTAQAGLTVYAPPALQIAKTPATDRPEVGLPLVYTLTVTNTGGPATGAVISDDLPAHTLFAGASSGGTLAGDTVVWDGLTVPAYGALSVSYGVTVTCVASGTLIVNDAYTVTAAGWPTPTVGLPVTVTAVAEGVHADFSFPTPVLRNWPVAFTNLSQHATAYQWTFGDGGSSHAAHPSHTYTITGPYTVILTATNLCASAVVSRPLTVEDYAVVVSPTAATGWADPGQTITHTLRVTNTGTLSETFQVTMGSHAWPAQLMPGSLSLDAGEGAEVTVLVTVPAGAAGGAQDSVQVTVRALSDPRTPPATASATLTSRANYLYAVALAPATVAQAALPGQTVTCTLRVTNLSNAVDTIAITRTNPGWPTAFSWTGKAIARGGWREVQVYVTVPVTVTGGLTDTAVVRATGSGGYAEAQLTTTAVWHTLYLPLVVKGP